MSMVTLPSPLALLAWCMLWGGGARDLTGAATSPTGSAALFTKSFLNSAAALACDCNPMLSVLHCMMRGGAVDLMKP